MNRSALFNDLRKTDRELKRHYSGFTKIIPELSLIPCICALHYIVVLHVFVCMGRVTLIIGYRKCTSDRRMELSIAEIVLVQPQLITNNLFNGQRSFLAQHTFTN